LIDSESAGCQPGAFLILDLIEIDIRFECKVALRYLLCALIV